MDSIIGLIDRLRTFTGHQGLVLLTLLTFLDQCAAVFLGVPLLGAVAARPEPARSAVLALVALGAFPMIVGLTAALVRILVVLVTDALTRLGAVIPPLATLARVLEAVLRLQHGEIEVWKARFAAEEDADHLLGRAVAGSAPALELHRDAARRGRDAASLADCCLALAVMLVLSVRMGRGSVAGVVWSAATAGWSGLFAYLLAVAVVWALLVRGVAVPHVPEADLRKALTRTTQHEPGGSLPAPSA